MIRTISAPFPVVRVEGDPRERGEAYGRQARQQIASSMSFYAEVMLPARGTSWGRLCDEAAAHIEAWLATSPDLIEEVQGIAQGSGFGATEVLALNCRGSLLSDEACTSFSAGSAITRSGHVLSGQNWDHFAGVADSLVLLHVRPPTGPRQLHIVEAGQVGRQGANSAGLSLQANGLPSRRADPSALPAPFIRRRILESPTLGGSLRAALAVPRPHANHLLLTHRDGFAVGLEVQPTSTSALQPERGWLAHANHFLGGVPDDLGEGYQPEPGSLIRQHRAAMVGARGVRSGMTIEMLSELCRDHVGAPDSVCAHADEHVPPHARWATVASVITDLDTGVMAVAAGPPCRSPYVEVDIDTGAPIRTVLPPEVATRS